MATEGHASLAATPLVVDGVEFRVAPLGGYEITDHLVIVKPMAQLEEYRDLIGRYERPRMIELGIAYGGSVGYLSLAGRPARLVGIELAPERVRLLDQLIADRGLGDQVHLHYGVDQADVGRLHEIVAEEFAGEPLDLVIDDASHLYWESRASFEALFPYVRPGGEYIIEDWACDHSIRALLVQALGDDASPWRGWAEAVVCGEVPSSNAGEPPQSAVAVASLRDDLAAVPPLSRLAAELALGPAEPASGIASVTTNGFWIEVRRSEVELEPGHYSLAGTMPDHFGTIADAAPPGGRHG